MRKQGWTLLQYVPMDVMNTIGFEGIKNMLLVFLAVLLVAVFFCSLFSVPTDDSAVGKPEYSAMKFTTKGHLEAHGDPKVNLRGNEMGGCLQYNSMAQRT